MDNISLTTRLRPLRFGFLVKPDDRVRLEKIFEINTCLWGGRYNPIIPYFKRVPMWWDRNGMRFDSAKQIINGYLDFFEPDMVVEAENGLAAEFGIDPKRVIQLSDILPRSDDRNNKGYGQSVFELYKSMFEEEFQFVNRNKHNIVNVRVKDKAFRAMAACLFGSFPSQKNLKYFASAYRDAFDPKQIELDAVSFENLLKKEFSSAMRIGSAKLEANFANRRDPTIFVFDAFEPRDLLDFWNLRAIHQNLMAVPVQWLPALSQHLKETISKNFRPLPGNSFGVMIDTTVSFSRSIPTEQIEPLFKAHLAVEREGANVVQIWYPQFWRPSPEIMVRQTRPTLECACNKSDVSIDVENPDIRFDTLHPLFAAKFGNEHRWANVTEIEDYSFKGLIATAFPTDFRRDSPVHLQFGGFEHLLSTTEGLVTFPRYKGIPNHWRLQDGAQAIAQWLKDQKIESRLSESGRSAQQIIQTMGGFNSLRALANKQIITLLDSMARRPITRSAQQREFQNKIHNALKANIWQNRVFELLVERRAVQLGYELKCSKCGSWNWYAIAQLKDSMTCDLCLREFEFPMAAPTESKLARWAYRVIGPFALPDYAKGGYAAALAMRLFAQVLGAMQSSGVTWSSGLELTMPDGSKAESDFILWYQRKRMFGTDYPTEIVFGEAKSFGREAFQMNDFERMKSLAEAFPGAVIVFATLKEADELSKDEINGIRKLALWGREYDRDRRQTRAPVIMLTGTELFASLYVESAWKDKGGKHRELVEPAYVQLSNLRTFANMTQQLYLGMPSYDTQLREKWNRKRERAERRAGAKV